jgi:hypothetical protein
MAFFGRLFTRRASPPRCPVEAGRSVVGLQKADESFDDVKFARVEACYAAVKAKPAYRDESDLFAQIDFLKIFLDGVFSSGSNSREVKTEIRSRMGNLGAAVRGNAIMTADDKLVIRQYLNAIYKSTKNNLKMARRQTRQNAARANALRELAEERALTGTRAAARAAERAAVRAAQRATRNAERARRAAARAARRATRNAERAARAARRGHTGRATARAETPESPNSPNSPNLPNLPNSPNLPVLPPLPPIVNSPNSPNVNLTGGRRKRYTRRH